MSQVRTFNPAIWAVAVTVQTVAARRAESSLCEPRAFLRVTTGPRMARSALLLSLLRYRNKDNYADVRVMPMVA